MACHAKRAELEYCDTKLLMILCTELLLERVSRTVKESAGLFRLDGKRPDGITQIPWATGKCLAWDVTVTDTLAPSYASISSISAGAAAERAAENKVAK